MLLLGGSILRVLSRSTVQYSKTEKKCLSHQQQQIDLHFIGVFDTKLNQITSSWLATTTSACVPPEITLGVPQTLENVEKNK